jgi:hypothetical protein
MHRPPRDLIDELRDIGFADEYIARALGIEASDVQGLVDGGDASGVAITLEDLISTVRVLIGHARFEPADVVPWFLQECEAPKTIAELTEVSDPNVGRTRLDLIREVPMEVLTDAAGEDLDRRLAAG